MSDDHGLVVKNNNGGVMFDSRKGMSSYVVREIGTGVETSFTLNDGDMVFAKRPSSTSNNWWTDKIIFGSSTLGPLGPPENPRSYGFYAFTDLSSGVSAEVNPVVMDYFVVTHAKNIDVSSEDYGLIIKNSDGTLQFDSRAIKNGQHFLITDYYPPRTFDGDPYSAPVGGLGDMDGYWSMNWTTGLDIANDVAAISVRGLKWIGVSSSAGATGPVIEAFFDVGGEEGGFDGGEGGGSTVSTRTYENRINGMILGAELI